MHGGLERYEQDKGGSIGERAVREKSAREAMARDGEERRRTRGRRKEERMVRYCEGQCAG